MSHDRTFVAIRLRNLALQFERGEHDAEFAAAEAPISDMRETVVERIRALADAIAGAE